MAASRLAADLAMRSDQATIRRWLANLASLVAGKQTVEEAKTRLIAYADLLADDVPALCFTRDTLKRAAAAFTWMPSFAELNTLIDAERLELGTRLHRLRLLAGTDDGAPSAPSRKRWTSMTEDERSAHDRRMAEHFADMTRGLPTTRTA